MPTPDFKEFSRLARDYTLVPVSKVVRADMLTPVSAFLAIAADEPEAFAEKVLQVFEDQSFAAEMASRARSEVVANWDMAAITARLVESYWDAVREKNSTSSSARGPL